MAEVAVEGDELVVRLSFWEKVGAMRGDVRVPLAAVRAVRVAPDPWSELRGLRSPGTGVPGVISLATRRGSFGKDFCAVYRKRPAVAIDLEGAPFARLVVSTPEPEAVAARLPVGHDSPPSPG